MSCRHTIFDIPFQTRTINAEFREGWWEQTNRGLGPDLGDEELCIKTTIDETSLGRFLVCSSPVSRRRSKQQFHPKGLTSGLALYFRRCEC